jgi:hypothetical protein
MGHDACIGEKCTHLPCKISEEETNSEIQTGDNIKIDVRETGCKDVNWTELYQDRFQ